MQSLRKIASRARTQTRVALFGNNHSLKVNMRYAAYEGAARRNWKPRSKPTAEQLAAAGRFKSEGFAALPPPARMTAEKLQAIRETVDRRFEEQNNGFVVNYGMYRMIDGLELIPEIIDFIDDDLEAIIENITAAISRFSRCRSIARCRRRTSRIRASCGISTIARSKRSS